MAAIARRGLPQHRLKTLRIPISICGRLATNASTPDRRTGHTLLPRNISRGCPDCGIKGICFAKPTRTDCIWGAADDDARPLRPHVRENMRAVVRILLAHEWAKSEKFAHLLPRWLIASASSFGSVISSKAFITPQQILDYSKLNWRSFARGFRIVEANGDRSTPYESNSRHFPGHCR